VIEPSTTNFEHLYDDPMLSLLTVHSLTANGNSTREPLRMRSITWPVYKGLALTAFLKSLTPICKSTLYEGYDEI